MKMLPMKVSLHHIASFVHLYIIQMFVDKFSPHVLWILHQKHFCNELEALLKNFGVRVLASLYSLLLKSKYLM